jgi:uncharacterized membrane protein YphA (DoxX/SURF4 family)
MLRTLCRETALPLVLRLGLAVIFLYHGADKITGRGRQWGANWHRTGPPVLVAAPRAASGAAQRNARKTSGANGKQTPPRQRNAGPPAAPRTVKADALPAPMQLAVAWGELLGGLTLLLGFLTRLAAAGLAVIMIGAIVLVSGEHGFPLLNEAGKWNGGFEYNFAVLVLCAAAVLAGGGRLSLDRLLFGRQSLGLAVEAEQPAGRL